MGCKLQSEKSIRYFRQMLVSGLRVVIKLLVNNRTKAGTKLNKMQKPREAK